MVGLADGVGMPGDAVILIGGGGHAGVVLDVCRAAGVGVVGVVDDDRGCGLVRAGLDWIGPLGCDLPDGGRWVLAIGDLGARRRALGGLDGGRRCGAIVHPSAVIGSDVELGDGTVVMPRAVINRGARIGIDGIVNTGAIVEHDCVIGDNAHLAPGSVLGGGVRVGGGTLVGIGACVIPGMVIGRGCVVGAGAVVVRGVGDGERVVGVPARGL